MKIAGIKPLIHPLRNNNMCCGNCKTCDNSCSPTVKILNVTFECKCSDDKCHTNCRNLFEQYAFNPAYNSKFSCELFDSLLKSTGDKDFPAFRCSSCKKQAK